MAQREFASPVVVKGIARGWFDQTDVPSWSPTYLGGIADESAECNGVIFRVTPAEFDSYTQRETGYRPTEIDPSQITMLDGSSAAPDGDIWYFANTRQRFPSDVHPIVQSYVDACLNGCLEIEAMYPPAKQANFAERFIRTTINWGPPWINDRIYPWRPFVYVPRAWAIDALISEGPGPRDVRSDHPQVTLSRSSAKPAQDKHIIEATRLMQVADRGLAVSRCSCGGRYVHCVPGFAKFVVIKKPATKERSGIKALPRHQSIHGFERIAFRRQGRQPLLRIKEPNCPIVASRIKLSRASRFAQVVSNSYFSRCPQC